MQVFLLTPEFWFGALVLCTFQYGKFNELNSIDPGFVRLSRGQNLKASDFAGRQAFAGALLLFLVVTLVLYFLLCLATPQLLAGWLRITNNAAPAENFNADNTYPLYVAAGFMGIAQQSIPGLSKIANTQRDLFHYLIGVPRTAILMTETASAAMFARGSSAACLGKLIETLVTDQWIASIRSFADVSFYKSEIERLELQPGPEIGNVKKGSTRELRHALEQLVYAASIATIRRSGTAGLEQLGRALTISVPTPDTRLQNSLRTGIVWFLLSLTALIFIIPLLRPAVNAVSLGAIELAYWPKAPEYAAAYVLAQFIPIIISTILMNALVPLSQPSAQDSKRESLIGLVNRNPGFVILVITTVVIFDYLQAFVDYGVFKETFRGNLLNFIKSFFPFHVLHAFISVTACLVMIRELRAAGTSTIGAALTPIVGLVGLASMFYASARSAFQLPDGFGLDYVVLIALLNILATLTAFAALYSVGYRGAAHPLEPAE